MAANALESNPEVMNKLLAAVGVPEKYKIHDVLGTEEENIAELPGNLKALLLVLPKDDFYKEALAEKDSTEAVGGVTFIQQSGGNLCGTVCLIHAVVNGVQGLELDEGPLKAFLDESKDLEPADRGVKLSENEAMIAAHNEAAADGQSNQVDGEAGHHMVCFVAVDGKLYDLDSQAPNPLCVGECDGGECLQGKGLAAAKGYMDRNPEGIQFNILALMEEN